MMGSIFTGHSGSGKSTVIDAMQIVLMPIQTAVAFLIRQRQMILTEV